MVASKTGKFVSDVPMTAIEVPLDLEPGTYRVKVTVTDEDSGQTIGVASTTYEVEAPSAPIAPEEEWTYYLILIAIALLAIAVVVSFKAASHTIEDMKARARRFVKKKAE